MDLHEIAKEIAEAGDGGLRLRQGVVTAIAADGTLTVAIAGSTVPVAGVRAFSSASAAVGAAVWLAVDGPLVLVIGSVGSGGSVPPGVVEPFGGAAAPAGWLLCNGASYLRTDYAPLFAAIGTTFGSADGTHFNVPDGRDRFFVGAGSSYAVGATGGSIHMPAHSHGQVYFKSFNAGGSAYRIPYTQDGSTTDWFRTDSTGAGPADENRPPYLALTAIIKT